MTVGRFTVRRSSVDCPDAPHLKRNRLWLSLCLGRTMLLWRRT